MNRDVRMVFLFAVPPPGLSIHRSRGCSQSSGDNADDYGRFLRHIVFSKAGLLVRDAAIGRGSTSAKVYRM